MSETSQSILYAVVELATGRIISSGSCLAGDLDTVSEDPEAYPAVQTDQHYKYNTHWYNSGVFEELTELTATWDKTAIIADGVDTATLSGLPVPCQVHLDGVVYAVDDGSFEFAAADPGEYCVWVDHPAHINKGWMLDAD